MVEIPSSVDSPQSGFVLLGARNRLHNRSAFCALIPVSRLIPVIFVAQDNSRSARLQRGRGGVNVPLEGIVGLLGLLSRKEGPTNLPPGVSHPIPRPPLRERLSVFLDDSIDVLEVRRTVLELLQDGIRG